MKIGIVGAGLMGFTVWTAGAAQAQNPATPLIQPPPPIVANTTPALPFVYTMPLPPVNLPAVGSPVQGFVESPVGPYGRLASPMTPPAAPVVGNRSTPLVPNGVLLSNGAIVDSNSVRAPAEPLANGPSFQTQQNQAAFRPVPVLNGAIEGRLTGGERDAPKLLVPAPTGAELMPTPPLPLNPRTPNARPAPPRAGSSLTEVIEALGNPVLTVTQSGGQVLYFKDGSQVAMKDGVVVR